MKTSTALLGIWLIVAACSSPAVTTTDPTTTSQAVSSTTAPEPGTSAPPPLGRCSGDEPMTEDGRVGEASQPSADSERIGLISWSTDPACEIFTIELVTSEGAPAITPPTFTADLDREVGVLRIHLEVPATSVTDQLVQSSLVDRYFVVRSITSPDAVFVDFILSQPALARVSAESAPGVVVVELEPGGSDYERAPHTGGLFVVTSPGEGATDVPIQIRGYGRPFEANVVMQVIQGSEVVTEAFTTSADYIDTWGEFSFDLDTTATGEANLFVGEFSAEDGSPRGVVIPVDLP